MGEEGTQAKNDRQHTKICSKAAGQRSSPTGGGPKSGRFCPDAYRWVPAASLPVSITASLNALWCPFSGATSFRLLAALPSGLAYSVVRCVTRPLNMLLAAKRL